jgi:PBP1b-binding outer membrane lipoprotein LpoB
MEQTMHYAKIFLMFFLATLLLCSCSNETEKEIKPGKIDTMTKKIGQDAAQMIKTPIDKAQAVADQEEKRIRKMDEDSSQ